MRVQVAAQATILVLELGLEWYEGWSEIIVYPSQFAPEREIVDEAGIVHLTNDPMSGEAWLGGPVILSYEDVALAGDEEARIAGYNVVIHEFAHKLDMRSGDPNGSPPLHADMSAAAWKRAFARGVRRLLRQGGCSAEAREARWGRRPRRAADRSLCSHERGRILRRELRGFLRNARAPRPQRIPRSTSNSVVLQAGSAGAARHLHSLPPSTRSSEGQGAAGTQLFLQVFGAVAVATRRLDAFTARLAASDALGLRHLLLFRGGSRRGVARFALDIRILEMALHTLVVLAGRGVIALAVLMALAAGGLLLLAAGSDFGGLRLLAAREALLGGFLGCDFMRFPFRLLGGRGGALRRVGLAVALGLGLRVRLASLLRRIAGRVE
jgi:hypothetical protein